MRVRAVGWFFDTLEETERVAEISLESFCAIAVEFDYFQEMSEILSNPKYTTGSELETINRNKNGIKEGL